ncbi:hypothetical protein NLJ89_g8559 [Agrocybe chaxingu]|uniref:Uncharacterized protein n=1 Tax=Agrocybe chaxingu TaxID=84603 RepID=A0A9W8JV78_9AGAR|nr:hypothetical protein NLJ89_g8559 [Agrocybe chaxingu]
MASSTSLPRRTHRKRVSALRLSSDTTFSLPEYDPTAYHNPHHHQESKAGGAGAKEESIPLDKPPDYPDSAEEGDEDTDPESDSNVVYVPQLPPAATLSPRAQTASPRRTKRFLPAHKRRVSSQVPSRSSDPFLDSLLERSVYALEMSNTLLQSSMSTQTSLSAILRSDSPGDSTLEARAIGLTSRIKDTWDAGPSWAADLEEISKGVEGLFGGDEAECRDSGVVVGVRRHGSGNSNHKAEGSLSCSLPTSSVESTMRRNRRRPSLDLRQSSDSTGSRLQLGRQSRANIVSPPPRALTQYVASTHDADSIILPSTIGLRSPPSVHYTPEWKPLSDLASSSTTSLLSTATFPTSSLPPKLTDKPLEPSTPAYNMLSSFVYKPSSSGSTTPSTSFTNSFIHSRFRDSSSTSTSTERSNGNPSKRRSSPSPKPPDSRTNRQDRSSNSQHTTPNRGVSPLALIIHRPMTPPTEESSHSSSSSDGCVAKLTVQSLRKILDDQPAPQDLKASSSRSSSSGRGRLKPPAFMPCTPAPVPQASTSTATASISRLFTKGTHSSSTRAPSPPRLSAMKHSRNSSLNTTPLPSPLSPPSPPEPPPNSISTLNPPPTLNSLATSTTANGTNPPTPTTALIPDIISKVLFNGRNSASASSSGRSTPNKRISFAELPESYASTRPAGPEYSTFNERRDGGRRKRRKGAKGFLSSPDLGGNKGGLLGSGGDGSWWGGWLTPSGLSMSLAKQEERMEDRMTRNWGGRMGAGFGGGLDEWAV